MRLHRLASVLLLAAAAVAASLPDEWKHWELSAPLGAPADDAPRLVRVLLSEAIAARALPQWADLRVIDDAGREVPFVLHARTERRSREARDARLLDLTHGPTEQARATVDLGAEPERGERAHNQIEILTPLENFSARVTLDASRDARRWRTLVFGAPIYRFARHDLEGNQTVRYVDSTSRYLRLRIEVAEGEQAFPVVGVRVWHEIREDAELAPVEVTLRPDPAAPEHESWWVADRGASALPVSAVEVATAQATFHRPVRVRTSDDGETWRSAGSGDVHRRSDAGDEREKLRVEFPETRARHLRVEIVDGSDAPLADVRLRLYGTPRRVVFRAEPGRSYRLLYGNSRAKAAQYEMARVIPAADLVAATPVEAGEGVVNSGYADPAPWTERHPVVLWVALLAAFAVLGGLAMRALRASAAPET